MKCIESSARESAINSRSAVFFSSLVKTGIFIDLIDMKKAMHHPHMRSCVTIGEYLQHSLMNNGVPML